MNMADFIPLVANLTGVGEKQEHSFTHNSIEHKTQLSSILIEEIIMISTKFKAAHGKVTKCKHSVYLWPGLELS